MSAQDIDIHVNPTPDQPATPSTPVIDAATLKLYETLIFSIASKMLRFAPGQAGETLKTIEQVLEKLAGEEWFNTLLMNVINAFAGGQSLDKQAFLAFLLDAVQKLLKA